MWVEKYRPSTVEEVVGNEEAKKEFIEWIQRSKRGEKRPKEMGIFLVGPPGTGKTSLVHAAAEQYNFHVLELNASDIRTGRRLEEALNKIPKSRPLDVYMDELKFEIVVFVDEVDGVHGSSDRGGLKTLLNIAKRRDMLMVLSANFPDPQKHRDLLRGFKVIRFWPLTTRQLAMLLKRIAQEEEIPIGDEVIGEIASRSIGDARQAINLLQITAAGGGAEDVDLLDTLPITETINRVLTELDERKIRRLISASLSTPQNLYRALAEMAATSNLDEETRCKVLDALSRIDIFMGRIMKTGDWKMLREVTYMIVGAVSTLRDAGASYVDRIPTYIFFRAIRARRREKVREIALNIGRRLQHSSRKAIFEVFPFLSFSVKTGQVWMAEALGLNEDDVKILKEIEL
ncbi:MAG: AAA family ATPase [Nitrososphaeria archaeon]|nr:AAA family ATPase [Nitrososphaeria archaeon]NIN53532.1 AAA family ATPase [Nitrososphaeria archaeon]NIQ34051.1 AAA family ATPase [Nitrososphaeria archaeon]